MTNSEIVKIFEDIFFEDDYKDTSRLHSPEFSLNEFQTQLVTLYGGMNGWGQCKDYLYDLYELVEALLCNGIDAYIVDFSIDALDDVFKVTIQLKELEDATCKVEESES